MPIQGRTWAITEMPSWGSDMGEICLMEEIGKADPPAVVTQHLDPPRKFVLINSQVRGITALIVRWLNYWGDNFCISISLPVPVVWGSSMLRYICIYVCLQGCYLMTKQQPVDQLRQLLLNTSPDSEQVKAFFKLHRVSFLSSLALWNNYDLYKICCTVSGHAGVGWFTDDIFTIAVVRYEVSHSYRHLFVFSFLTLLSLHSLSTASNFYLLLLFSILPFSPYLS